MTAIEMQNRLTQLRTGFDIAIERTLRQKAANGWPIIVAGADGVPVQKDARKALDDFYALKAQSAKG